MLECSQQFFRRARAHNWSWWWYLPKFEVIQAFMHVLVTCKNEVDPIKNEGARMFTRFFHYTSMGIFPDAQGHLTPQSLVRSGQISNSSEIWMSLLPASIKKIQSKMKELECSQDFSHYNHMGAIGCHRNQSSNPIWPKTFCSLSTYHDCYTQSIKALDLMVSEKKIFLRFLIVSLREMMTPGRG